MSRMSYLSESRIGRACICAMSDGVPKRSLVVAIVIGTILNAINQGDVLLAHKSIDWLKAALTYLVPYGVATYGAVSLQLRNRPRIVPERPVGSDST